MMKPCTLVLIVLLGLHGPWTAQANGGSIVFNCPDRNWHPFLYTQNDRLKGILFDIVSQAMQNLKIGASIQPVPFRRALLNARRGTVDGVIAVGHHPDLDQVLDFPPGADTAHESPYRIMQVDNVVVSIAESDYEFAGDLLTLPEPVRIVAGDPIVDKLNLAGVSTQEVREDVQNFMKLIRDKKGVIITTSVTAEMMNRDSRYNGKIKIHAVPVVSQGYFVAFSKHGTVPEAVKSALYEEIRRLREDYIFILQVFSRH